MIDNIYQKTDGFYWNGIFFGKSKINSMHNIEKFISFIEDNKFFFKKNSFKATNCISSVEQLSYNDLISFFERHGEIKKEKSVINYFLEPSLRTRMSFERSCQKLNINYSNCLERNYNLSSVDYVRNEAEKDIITTISCIYDLIISRHPSPYFPLFIHWNFQENDIRIPFINAGSGSYEHPTQSIIDMYTIYKNFGGINNKTICFFGDCSNVRSIRSLAKLFTVTKNPSLYFISPDNKKPNADIIDYLEDNGVNNIVISSYLDIPYLIPKADILYLARDAGGKYCLSPEIYSTLKEDAIVLHPLPKDDEIHPKLNNYKKIKIYDQIKNSVYIRSSLMYHML